MKHSLLLALVVLGCSRQADIYDQPEQLVAPPMPSADELPSVPNLDLQEFPECATRPEGECRGVNDFPCAFTKYAKAVIDECFHATECSADGWVSVTLGDDGCLADIGMEHVDEAFVECLRDTIGPISCPCEETTHSVFLGVANDGCRVDTGPDG
jgi:hypothetical protein